MEQHDHRRSVAGRTVYVEPVEVDEIAVGGVDALTPVMDLRAAPERGIDRLGVPPRQPARRDVSAIDLCHQSASFSRSTIVLSTFTRAKYLSSASTTVQGAISVLVLSIMSHTARS